MRGEFLRGNEFTHIEGRVSQEEAALAVAFELRTASLIAIMNNDRILQTGEAWLIIKEIRSRLGLPN